MCFDQTTSFGFAENKMLSAGVFWFFLMELLQGFQYFWIDDCDHPMNKALTLLGFIHICYQPFFTHVINVALTRNPKVIAQYSIVLRLCLLGGTALLARYFFAEYSTTLISSDYTDWAGLAPAEGSCRTTEWLRGETLCTFRGRYHLAWSVPMYDPTYWSPGAAIHSFLMFGPFFVMSKITVIQAFKGIFLWAAGPLMASFITPNLMEQASIWCFFSIGQIALMLFLIRSSLTKRSPSSSPQTNGKQNNNGKQKAK